MQISKSLVVGLIVLIAVAVSASDYDAQARDQDLSLLARLSYQNSSVQSPATQQSQHICLSVYVDGHYRVLRTNEAGYPQMQEGKLTNDQLNQLQFLLNSSDFRSLSGSHGSLVRGKSENFIAEIPRAKNVQHVVFTIADETPRFPKAVAYVVKWLTNFTPVNAITIEQSEFPDVCPRMQMSPVEPVAEGFGLNANRSCANQKAR